MAEQKLTITQADKGKTIVITQEQEYKKKSPKTSSKETNLHTSHKTIYIFSIAT
jgi:hypothetical protein